MTIDDLAVMVARGFEQTASKDELIRIETKMDQGFARVDARVNALEEKMTNSFQHVNERLDLIHRDSDEQRLMVAALGVPSLPADSLRPAPLGGR